MNVTMPALDPFPYVGQTGSRHAFPGWLGDTRLQFAPRAGFVQEELEYLLRHSPEVSE